MHRLASQTKHLASLAFAASIALLSGCATTPDQAAIGQPSASQTFLDQAEDSSARGNYIIAAQSYMTLANQSSGMEQQKYFLAAASILIRGQHIERARTIINQIDPAQLPQDEQMRYHLAHARLALLELQPELTLYHLRQPAETVPDEAVVDWHSLRAEAYAMTGNHVEAVRERMVLEKRLTDPIAIRRNHHQIWQVLSQLSDSALATLRTNPPPDELSGWLELSLLYKTSLNNQAQLEQQLQTWLSNYPAHPAADQFITELLLFQEIQLDRPRHIALLLPLSGNFATPAKAVRDGFLAAYYNRDGISYSPEIRIYDTTDDVIIGLEVYQKAISEGANFIVGPLHKPLVEALASLEQIPVPTLALNYWSNPGMVANNFYQFGLLPEDEARQVAERAWLDGYSKALILAPEGEWGDRMASTFQQHWQQLDGFSIETQRYQASKHDFSAPVIQLLNIDESRQRKQELQRLTGLDIKFEPRRRQDVDFIYLAAFPNQARQIRPQLKFYYAADIPVYSSSHIFSGEQNPTLDRDMDGIIFSDMPWVFTDGEGHQPNWQLFTNIWHSNAIPFKRLYAMGIDAYRLISHLGQMSENQQAHLSAETGKLYLDQANRIHRQLMWARFRSGRPELIETQSLQPQPPL